MSSASPEGFLTRANPPPPIELISGSVTPTAAAAATAASAALPPALYVSAAASAAYGVPAAAAKVLLGALVSIIGYYAPSLPCRAAQGCKMPVRGRIGDTAQYRCLLLPLLPRCCHSQKPNCRPESRIEDERLSFWLRESRVLSSLRPCRTTCRASPNIARSSDQASPSTSALPTAV